MALTCLYWTFEHNPKIQWYSASTWECHTLAHSKENLPIYPKNPAFSQQFSKTEAIPSTSRSELKFPHAEAVCKCAEVAKHFLEHGSEKLSFHCPPFKDPDPSPHETPKCRVKQGPVKSSKKFKEADPKSKGDNE